MRSNKGEIRTREAGSAFIVGLIVVVAMASLAAAFIQTGASDSQGNVTAAILTKVMSITESGINTAIADVNAGGTGALGDPKAHVAFGGGDYYVTSTSLGPDTYRLLAVGELNGVRRAIEAIIAPEETSIFANALFGDIDLGARGHVFTDSYDSDTGTYASQATNTHPDTGDTHAGTNGSLASNQNITIRGGATILGNAIPGPTGSVSVRGGHVYIDGSTSPAPAEHPMPAVEYEPPIAATGDWSPSKKGNFTFSDGTYHFTDLKLASKSVLTFEGQVVLYVDDTFQISGQAEVVIAPDSQLTVYHGGGTFQMTGQGITNQTLRPDALQVYTVATSVKFTGQSGFYGVVYAPQGSIKITGNAEVFGSYVGRELDLQGNADFHYDERLSRATSSSVRVRLVSWRRVAPPAE
jgi:putative adhesin